MIPQPQDTEWIIIHLTYNAAEAQVIAGKLRAAGIPAMLHQEAAGGALGITVGKLGEIKVLVRPADYAEALIILGLDGQDELPDTAGPVSYYSGGEDDGHGFDE